MTYALSLLSSALYGIADFLGGFATRRTALLTVTVASQGVGLIGLAILVPLLSPFPGWNTDLLWGAGAGVCGGAGIALLYHGLAIGSASLVAPITAVCSIAVPVGVDVLAGARPSERVLGGIALGMVAVALLSLGGSEHSAEASRRPVKHRSVVMVAFAAGVAIGLFLVCLGRTRHEAGMWPLLVARVVSVSGFALACAFTRTPLLPARQVVGLTVGAGVFDVLANAAYVVAVRQGSLGPIATLASLYPASTVLLGRVVWHERLRRVQLFGLGLALLAIALITWARR